MRYRKPMNYHQTKIAESAYVAEQSVIIGDVAIGENSSVLFFTAIRGDDAPVRIGRATNIQENCTIHTSERHPTILGDHVTVGHNAVLHGCSVGDESLIGMGAIVLDGAKIGRQCLVAAGSLVTKDTVIPDGSMVMGSPAKVKRALTEEEKAKLYENSAEYVLVAEDLKRNGIIL